MVMGQAAELRYERLHGRNRQLVLDSPIHCLFISYGVIRVQAMTTSLIDVALRKILSARAKGTLPADLIFAVNAQSIGLDLPHSSPNFDALFQWVQKNYPGGVLAERCTRFRGTGPRRWVYDKCVYRASLESGPLSSYGRYITVQVRVPHIHTEYSARSTVKDRRSGLPKWLCTGCSKPISLTEARKLGLLPEKAAK